MSTHADLVARAAAWLRNRRRLAVVLADYKTVSTSEQPDAIGWTASGWSVLVECKTSRADFLRDRRKWCRRKVDPMGQERWYLCDPGVIRPVDLPDGWGLLWTGRSARVVVPARRDYKIHRPEELPFVLAALRRALANGASLAYMPPPGRLGAAPVPSPPRP